MCPEALPARAGRLSEGGRTAPNRGGNASCAAFLPCYQPLTRARHEPAESSGDDHPCHDGGSPGANRGSQARHQPRTLASGPRLRAAGNERAADQRGRHLVRQLRRRGVFPERPARPSAARTGGRVSESRHARRPRRWLLWVALGTALVVGDVAGGLIVGATQSSGSSVSSGTSASSSTASACPVTPVANQVIPSVVTIAASGPSGSGTGSGEFIRSGGYILTNNHVISIAANGDSVKVLFADGHTDRRRSPAGTRKPTLPCSRCKPPASSR